MTESEEKLAQPHETRGERIAPRTSAEFGAWAYALHVTEQELSDAVDAVGDSARDVISYLLKRKMH
jgi:hypothetical protein